jgi:hypothetical protein
MTKRPRKRRPSPRGPTLVTPEGDPIALCTALYRHSRAGELSHTLAQAGDFEPADDEPSPEGLLSFAWYGPEPPSRPHPAPLGRSVLAVLTLGPEALQIQAMSERRLARCRRRIEGLAGDRLHLLRTEVESVEQAMARPPSGDEPEPVVLPPEELADLQEHMLREWIDAPIPALDGMTPRQAARTRAGRQRVRDLVAYIERQQAARPPRPGSFTPDYRQALAMLGID